MAKAIVSVGGTFISLNLPFISYSVSLIGPPNSSYGSDYPIDTGITIAANITALKNKVIADAASKGVVIVATDVIICGAPS